MAPDLEKILISLLRNGRPTVPGCASHSAVSHRATTPVSVDPYCSQITGPNQSIMSCLTFGGHGAPVCRTWRSVLMS